MVANPELWELGRGARGPARASPRKIERLNRDGTPYEAEYRFRRPDGRIVWVHDQAVMIRDENGTPRFSQGVMFDITERREAEEQLRETEERFRAIVEHVPAGDLPGRARHQHADALRQPADRKRSPASRRRSGSDDPDSWVDALHPDDREEVLGRYLAARRRRGAVERRVPDAHPRRPDDLGARRDDAHP